MSRATVITVSDGVAAGAREDLSGAAVEAVLAEAGFEVARITVPDERPAVSEAILRAASSSELVLTTGGTGFGPRDVTPEATADVLDREAPGLVQVMVAKGLETTPMAALSRSRAGTVGSALVINLPGSPGGATESLAAVIDLLGHALALLAGHTRHHAGESSGQG